MLAPAEVFAQRSVYSVFLGAMAAEFLGFLDEVVVDGEVGWPGI